MGNPGTKTEELFKLLHPEESCPWEGCEQCKATSDCPEYLDREKILPKEY
jgi:hypothetical protein